jgi:hypothetical protein
VFLDVAGHVRGYLGRDRLGAGCTVKWTARRLGRLRHLAAQGHTRTEAADALGVTYATVNGASQYYRVPFAPVHEPLAGDLSQAEAALRATLTAVRADRGWAATWPCRWAGRPSSLAHGIHLMICDGYLSPRDTRGRWT